MAVFTLPWNTGTAANGPHTIYAVIKDLAGNSFTSSSITITTSNTVPSTDPPLPPPPPPPTPVPGDDPNTPTATIVTAIPLGALFYNTLGEFSTFNAESIFPSTIDPNLDQGLTDDYFDVQRDYGVTGNGSNEVEKVQAALDQAADNVLSGSGKTKVLIPSSVSVAVGPIEDDLSDGGFFGPMGVCLWLDSGVTFKVSGTLRPHAPSVLAYSNDFITLLETRNSFVGDSTDRDESIVIEGNGVIDLEGIYDDASLFTEDTAVTKQIKNVAALRSYKCDKITVKDVTIRHGIFHKLIHGFSNQVEVLNVKFDRALKYESNSSPVETDTALVTLDVCRSVLVAGCLSNECGVYFGVSSWATTDVIVSNNNFSDLISGDGSLAVNARGTGFWFVDYGMEYVELDMAYDLQIYDLDNGLDAKTLITNNLFCRNGSTGVSIFGGAWASVLTRGFSVCDNQICSNADIGIYYDGLEGYLFSSNQINDNGWGLPLQFD